MKVYTIKEVAEMLQVSERTIYTYLYEGQLKGSKLGRVWRIEEQAVQELLNAKRKDFTK